MARLGNCRQRCNHGTDDKELNLEFLMSNLLLISQERRLETQDWMAVRADFSDVIESGLKEILLSIIAIAVHVEEVRPNDIKKRAGIKSE